MARTADKASAAEPALEALLRSKDLHSGSDASLRRLAQHMRRRRFPPRSVIFLEGDDAGPACLIDEGTVWLTTARPDGTPYFVGEVCHGELIGDLTAIAERPRTTTATATAAGPVVLWEIPSHALRDALASDAGLAFSMMMHMIDWVLGKDERAALRASQGTRQRTAKALIDLVDRATGRELNVTHDDLAMMVGATRENVSRVLASLRRSGVIETNRRRITILDRDRLDRIAGT